MKLPENLHIVVELSWEYAFVYLEAYTSLSPEISWRNRLNRWYCHEKRHCFKLTDARYSSFYELYCYCSSQWIKSLWIRVDKKEKLLDFVKKTTERLQILTNCLECFPVSQSMSKVRLH